MVEPLKNKKIPGDNSTVGLTEDVFLNSDVFSAVEWLKKQVGNLISEEGESDEETLYKLIDLAFEDVKE